MEKEATQKKVQFEIIKKKLIYKKIGEKIENKKNKN